MEDKGYLVKFVPILVLAFPLLPREGIYSAHSSKVSALSQMGEALRKSISSSINSKYSIAKVAYFGLACLLPSLSSDECFIQGSTPCISDSSTSPPSSCLSDLVGQPWLNVSSFSSKTKCWGWFSCVSLPSSGNLISSVQSLSRVWLFVTPYTAARQASLSITNSWSLLKFMSIKLVMPSNHLILCCPLLSSYLQSFPASGSFPMSPFFASGSQSIGASPSASVLPMNIQKWFPLGLTDWMVLQSKGLSSLLQCNISKGSVL